ncbi:MAG: IS4 family transposase, partial [Rickettsiaceae bacterium]|nr:IS4 family transposase [Rickettsiaceae bacterium]
PPDTPPSISAMNKVVASFGGFLGRKGDGEPGIKAMWIGLQRLKDFTLAFETLNSCKTYG